MAGKASPKGGRGGGSIGTTFLLFSGLEGSWGGHGTSWGPRADFNRFMVDFSWILVDF